MTGEAAPLLVDLVERGIIRVLDVMFATKNEDGTFSGFDARDLTEKGVGDFEVFEGASSGLLGDEDAEKTADAIEPGTSAVVLVYENRWAAPFVAAGAPQRRCARRIRADSNAGPDRRPRRRRDAGVLTEGKEACQDYFAEWPALPSSPVPRPRSRTA
jgi:hypothetical protein